MKYVFCGEYEFDYTIQYIQTYKHTNMHAKHMTQENMSTANA